VLASVQVFELHGDKVSREGAVPGGDGGKSPVQDEGGFRIFDWRQQSLRRPAGGDTIGDNADAIKAHLRIVRAGKRQRPRAIGWLPSIRDQGERHFVNAGPNL